MKTRLNLATHRFPRYRAINLLLAGVLVVALAAGGGFVYEFMAHPPDVGSLRVQEEAVRQDWEDLGQRVGEIDGRLRQPESSALLSELTFLSQIVARKDFSWTLVLREIARVIPRNVFLVGLAPEISEDGHVFLQMEVRGRSVDDVAEFISGLEKTDAFRNVKVASDEAGVDGLDEVRVVMGADYVAAAMSEVSIPGD